MVRCCSSSLTVIDSALVKYHVHQVAIVGSETIARSRRLLIRNYHHYRWVNKLSVLWISWLSIAIGSSMVITIEQYQAVSWWFIILIILIICSIDMYWCFSYLSASDLCHWYMNNGPLLPFITIFYHFYLLSSNHSSTTNWSLLTAMIKSQDLK